MKLPNPYTQRKLGEAWDLPPRNGPFAAINVGFHETYTRLVEQVLAQLGDSVPVVILVGDDAALLCDGGEQREQVIPIRYHELKALAHLASGVQLTRKRKWPPHRAVRERTSCKARTDSGSAGRHQRLAGLCVLLPSNEKGPPSCYAARVRSSTEFSPKAWSI